MESKFEGSAYPNLTRAGEIYGAAVAKLRDPDHESALARFHKAAASSANMACNRIMFSILDHHDNGGTVATAKGAILDIERMETRGEEFVYDTSGKIIHLDADLHSAGWTIASAQIRAAR